MQNVEKMVEDMIDKKIEDVLMELEVREEMAKAEKEFYANFYFIQKLIPDTYHINLMQLESVMRHLRIADGEHAYRMGLYDGMNIGKGS